MIKMFAPFTIVFQECKSGHWLAWYQKRGDIIANGETKEEVEKNLIELHKWVMEYEKFETLKDDLCIGCGEKRPKGLMEYCTHNPACQLSTFVYRKRRFQLKHLEEMISGIVPMSPFRELLDFDYFDAMPDFETASTIDKILYYHARQSDIRTMKRLRAYIELEEELDAKY